MPLNVVNSIFLMTDEETAVKNTFPYVNISCIFEALN